MNSEQLEKLWETRFHKILDLEEDSLSFYRNLAEHEDLIAENPRLRELLEEVLNDEMQHTTICRELLQIVHRKKKKARGENDDF
jgi:rubrerythrin